MDQHTISSMMFCSSMKCLQVGTTPAECRIERTTCWCLPGTFETFWSRMRWLSRKNCYGRWNLGTLPPAGNLKASKEWRHISSPKLKKFSTQSSAGKVLLILFWDEWGVILEHYMPRGNRVTSATYADLPKNYLRPAIKCKRRGLLSTGVLLQHDNARPHTARLTVATIQDLSFESLPHPPYSPDLAPQWLSCLWTAQRGDGRQVFQVRRKGATRGAGVAALSAKRFFFSTGIHALPKRWNTCMERNGDHIKNEFIVYLLCSINYEIKYLTFSFDSPSFKEKRLQSNLESKEEREVRRKYIS